MARRKSAIPELKYHESTRQYCTYWKNRRVTFGGHEGRARQKFRRWLDQWLAARDSGTPESPTVPVSNELRVIDGTAAYEAHARVLYAHQPKQLSRIQRALAAVDELFRGDPIDSFGGRALKAVREKLLEQDCVGRPGEKLSRNYVNKLVRCIQRAWKWMKSEDMVSRDNLEAILCVEPLRENQGGREVSRVMPAPVWAVDATLPHLGRVVAAMVGLQRLCGLRPKELCSMRRGDVSTSPAEKVMLPKTDVEIAAFHDEEGGTGRLLWVYVPGWHKTLWRGKVRAVPLGPEAQEILRPFMDRPADAFIFSPAEAVAEWVAQKRTARQSKVTPSQERRAVRAQRRRSTRRRAAGECYTTASYGRAIGRAIERANAARAEQTPPLPPVPDWRPNQLRHQAATGVAERFNEDYASAVLGNSKQMITQTYAKLLLAKAGKVAAAIG